MVAAFLLSLLFLPLRGAGQAQPQPEFREFRERAIALSGRNGAWSDDELKSLMSLLVPEPDRFAADSRFRAALTERLAVAWEPRASPRLRELLLSEFGRSGILGFDALERLQFGWGAVERVSASRRRAVATPAGTFFSDAGGAIGASIFCLTSDFFAAADAERFLRVIRANNPDRPIVVFVDGAMAESLRTMAGGLKIRLLDTLGWEYTPWTRDSFTLLAGTSGSITVLVRPDVDLQRPRERDNAMGRELIKDLPADLDSAWGKPSWAVSKLPFHNGQALLTRDAAWISLHTLEPRILSRLKLSRVPAETFGTAEGVRRYVDAAKAAARELEAFYGRRVRFVHPLPEARSPGDATALMAALGGGAGFDLDSLLTLVEVPGGTTRAIVADIAAGREILHDAPSDDLSELAKTYDFSLPGGDLRERIDRAQETPKARRLARFLDLCAGEMKARGLVVLRAPFLLLPGELRRVHGEGEPEDFVLGWNNVVVESKGSDIVAEGFAGGFAAGDRRAVQVFRAAGCRLRLVPPLVHSVVLNGGYRCASNHLRRSEG